MAIERRNVKVGSTLRHGPINPQIVTLPPSDFAGIALSQSVAKGANFVLNGPMMVDGLNGYNATNMLRIPTAISIRTAANADKVLLDVEGLDHLGRPARGPVWKTNTSCAVESGGYIVWSRIDRVTLADSSSTPLTLSLGVSYNAYAVSGSALITGTGGIQNQGRAIRRIPLPFAVRSAADLIGIEFLGWAQGGMQLITKSPNAGNITYSTANDLTATSSAAWDLSGVAAGDLAYTRDGCVGIITLVEDANERITVERWVRHGLAVDDMTDYVGNANAQPGIVVYRPATRTLSQMGTVTTSATISPMIPGAHQPAASQSATLTGTFPDGSACPTDIAGLHIPSSTFGIQTYALDEPVTPIQYNVAIATSAY